MNATMINKLNEIMGHRLTAHRRNLQRSLLPSPRRRNGH
jgi:hypothetical protein